MPIPFNSERRKFLSIAGLAAAGAIVSACVPEGILPTESGPLSTPITRDVEPTPTSSPTLTPEAKVTVRPTETVVPTVVPEVTATEVPTSPEYHLDGPTGFGGVDINGEFLSKKQRVEANKQWEPYIPYIEKMIEAEQYFGFVGGDNLTGIAAAVRVLDDGRVVVYPKVVGGEKDGTIILPMGAYFDMKGIKVPEMTDGWDSRNVTELSKGTGERAYYESDFLTVVRADSEGNVIETWNHSEGRWKMVEREWIKIGEKYQFYISQNLVIEADSVNDGMEKFGNSMQYLRDVDIESQMIGIVARYYAQMSNITLEQAYVDIEAGPIVLSMPVDRVRDVGIKMDDRIIDLSGNGGIKIVFEALEDEDEVFDLGYFSLSKRGPGGIKLEFDGNGNMTLRVATVERFLGREAGEMYFSSGIVEGGDWEVATAMRVDGWVTAGVKFYAGILGVLAEKDSPSQNNKIGGNSILTELLNLELDDQERSIAEEGGTIGVVQGVWANRMKDAQFASDSYFSYFDGFTASGFSCVGINKGKLGDGMVIENDEDLERFLRLYWESNQ